jgi:hypothetical protein
MFAASLAVVLLGALLLGGAIVAFAWAWARGELDPRPEHAAIPLDPRDLRVARPWETEAQAAERRADHGEPLPPEPGEWGGGR